MGAVGMMLMLAEPHDNPTDEQTSRLEAVDPPKIKFGEQVNLIGTWGALDKDLIAVRIRVGEDVEEVGGCGETERGAPVRTLCSRGAQATLVLWSQVVKPLSYGKTTPEEEDEPVRNTMRIQLPDDLPPGGATVDVAFDGSTWTEEPVSFTVSKK